MVTERTVVECDDVVVSYIVLQVTQAEVSATGWKKFREGMASIVGAGADHAIVDLSGVDFLFSSVITTLLHGRSVAEACGTNLVVVVGTGSIARFFHQAGLDRAFVTASSRDEAVALVGRA